MTHGLHSNERAKNSTDPVFPSTKPPERLRNRKRKEDYSGWFFEPYNPVRGENALWVAVITQAMMDGLSRSNNAEALYHKHEAIRWLTGNSKDFIQVCLLAGMDPDYVRRKAKRSLIAPVSWRAEAGKGRRYLERKAYRQRKNKRKPPPAPPLPVIPIAVTGQVITGPWQ